MQAACERTGKAFGRSESALVTRLERAWVVTVDQLLSLPQVRNCCCCCQLCLRHDASSVQADRTALRVPEGLLHHLKQDDGGPDEARTGKQPLQLSA